MTHDPSHTAWVQNARKVKKHPKRATPLELAQAIDYLRFQRGRLILTARRLGHEPSEEKLAAIDTQIEKYVALVTELTPPEPVASA